MSEETPILRADALDEEDLVDPEVPNYATGGLISDSPASGSDGVPPVLDNSTIIPRKHFGYECYENGEGGWSYRVIYHPE